jgi:hypothetical protein
MLVELMPRAKALDTPADWLVRAKHNRCLPDGDKLWARNCAGEALGQIVFTMPSRHGQKERKLRQELWAATVELHAGKPGAVTMTCVIAREIDAAKGVKPIEWRLLTNRSAPTLEDVIELIDWYRVRWDIEMFFNVLKTVAVSNRRSLLQRRRNSWRISADEHHLARPSRGQSIRCDPGHSKRRMRCA